MPLTPLHYCPAYVLHKIRLELTLPALAVGAVIPDLESLVGIATGESLMPSRGLMHSLVGAVTLDALLAVLITMFLYPAMVSWVFKLDKKEVVEKCRFSLMLVMSSLLGSLSHVLVDSTSHEYNPLLYPFTSHSFDALVFMNSWILASNIVHIVLLSVLLIIFVNEARKGTQGFWKRLLVG